MDYKYIEQLLERYWQCEVSLEEEQILRTFFQQKEIPSHLLPYKNLFEYERAQQKIGLDENFDKKILACIEKPVVKARKITMRNRLIPLLKAVAVVAVIISLGNIIQRSVWGDNNLDYNYDAYKDTYNDPQVAYKQVTSALMMISEKINQSQSKEVIDSLTIGEMDAKKMSR